MRKRPYSTLATIILVIAVIAGLVKVKHMRVIQGHVGEPVSEFLKRNQEKMDTARYSDSQPLIFPANDLSGETFRFVYDEDGASIDLPTARLIWFTQYAGVVCEITINTSEQKGTLQDLYGQLHSLRKSLIEARWEEIQPMGSFNDLQATVSHSEGTTNSFSAGKYKKSDTEALIMVTSPGAVITPDKANQAAFVAEIWFNDQVLEKQQHDKMVAARLKVNGKDTSLPMNYWVK